jgi:hypothetical protein
VGHRADDRASTNLVSRHSPRIFSGSVQSCDLAAHIDGGKTLSMMSSRRNTRVAAPDSACIVTA